MNIDMREDSIGTTIYCYMSSWTIKDVEVTNSKIIARFESDNLHKSQDIENCLKAFIICSMHILKIMRNCFCLVLGSNN